MKLLRRMLVVALLLLSFDAADAARVKLTCKVSDPTFVKLVRIPPPNAGGPAYPPCEESTSSACVFVFCPSLAAAVHCDLGHRDPRCPAIHAVDCNEKPDIPQERFTVPCGRRLRLHVGRNRVVLGCSE